MCYEQQKKNTKERTIILQSHNISWPHKHKHEKTDNATVTDEQLYVYI